jgi:hypothetical protein
MSVAELQSWLVEESLRGELEDKISSLRRRGCHGKRFDTFVTPYLAGVQR